jgi:hypothetical protein
MITVKVTCDTGKEWVTDINSDLDGARKYFIGEVFTDENFETGEEVHNTAISVEEVSS